jgi:hypothetical protein
MHQLSATPPAEPRVVEPKKAPSRESLFAANVMEIRSFAALKKTSGAFARQQSHHGVFSA